MGSKTVHRTANTRRAAVVDMSINHRRLDVMMAQEINGSWNLFLVLYAALSGSCINNLEQVTGQNDHFDCLIGSKL